ncbi:MAG: hypothetical protein ACKOAH_21255, partial [Pirellula sp.]
MSKSFPLSVAYAAYGNSDQTGIQSDAGCYTLGSENIAFLTTGISLWYVQRFVSPKWTQSARQTDSRSD